MTIIYLFPKQKILNNAQLVQQATDSSTIGCDNSTFLQSDVKTQPSE